jgi:predicted transcriptional regulator
MESIVNINPLDVNIGLVTRKSKEGPETKLVDNFIDYIYNSSLPKNRKLAVFKEPQLDTGYPDIVLIEYLPEIYEQWPEARTALQTIDLKILHFLYTYRGATSYQLENLLGIKSKALLRSLERLLDSKLIYRSSKKWRTLRLNHIFAIKKIIAIEAKINNWQSAFHQANLDKWFASESYVLSPIIQPSAKTIDLSSNYGVGIFTCNKNGVQKLSDSCISPLPSCYASWLFNEWIGRYQNFVN